MLSSTVMKIVLVHTPCPELENDRLEPPLGILYLATILKKEGIHCQICDLSGILQEDWQKSLPVADVYGFSTYSVNYHRTLVLRNIAKQLNPEAITLAGGPHVTALPNDCADKFDVIITGEAEDCFLELIRQIMNGKKPKGIFQGKPIIDLDSLPFPDYSLIDLQSYNRIVEGSSSVSLISSRGCPYQCSFCNSRVFSRGMLRFRSPENIVHEIQQLKDSYGINTFRFNDDLFTFSPARIIEMSKVLKPMEILYRVFARSSSMTKEAACMLYGSGCRHVAIGIESMSGDMLKLLKKQTDRETNIAALKNAKDAGLKVRIYLLVGFPGETEKTFQESLDVLLGCEFDEFIVYPFIPYPGTAVWSNPELWGATIDRDFSNYVQVGKNRRTSYAVTTKDFTPDDVKNWREHMIAALEEKFRWAGKSIDNR